MADLLADIALVDIDLGAGVDAGGSGQLGHGNTANIGDEPGEMQPADVTCH